jgi:hypothetical protein
MHPDTKCNVRWIGPLNVGAKPYVRKKSQIVGTDSNQRPVIRLP